MLDASSAAAGLAQMRLLAAAVRVVGVEVCVAASSLTTIAGGVGAGVRVRRGDNENLGVACGSADELETADR